ncbi:MAG: GTP-binding protein [Arthrospira platensis PCC 7345]|uniref:CobW family GTP-binding protein n=1 Tax=Limnospira platensis TaxID=118562 RepID=UPI0028E0FA4D|nr:GTP-binding protein [Arthrospira platensis PCC 7345]
MKTTREKPTINREVPVIVITGFLGSGKTTLINYILSHRNGRKVAVFVNEFGEISIDGQLLINLEDDMVQLNNGCICCTLNDRLADTIVEVLQRNPHIDYLLIETTGIADPLPIIMTFGGTELRNLTRLDAIFTLVDADTFSPDLLANSEAALNQIAWGDLILLNKIDLVAPEKCDRIQKQIRQLKPDARIITTEYGEVPLATIWGIEYSHPDFPQLSDHDHQPDHDHHSQHLANDGFVAVSFSSDRPLSVEKFQTFLSDRLPTNVFRAKGFIWYQGNNSSHLFQLSGKRYQLTPNYPRGEPPNQLVFIGRDLNRQTLTQDLQRCLHEIPNHEPRPIMDR